MAAFSQEEGRRGEVKGGGLSDRWNEELAKKRGALRLNPPPQMISYIMQNKFPATLPQFLPQMLSFKPEYHKLRGSFVFFPRDLSLASG